MSDRPLIFISHASSDKQRIGHIVDHLLRSGFRLFIDHPENIDPRYTPQLCDELGIEALWTTPQPDWSVRLIEAIRSCDCVLVIASEALTEGSMAAEERGRLSTYRMEWKAEMEQGYVLGKVAFAKIESFDSSRIPSHLRAQDAQNVAQELDPAALATNLGILVEKRIKPAIEAGRGMSNRNADRFRSIKDLLPLCVGRSRQRRAILDSAAEVATTGRIRPVVIVGPRNELPHRFLEALPFYDDGRESPQSFVLHKIDWPDGPAQGFARDFAENLAEEVCRDHSAGLEAVAKRIGQTGHPAIIHSRYAIETRSVSESALGEWLGFWERFGEAFKGTQVVPALSLFLRPARPGWSECPPREEEDAEQRRRNLEAWAWLGSARQILAEDAGRFRLPPITMPIQREHAERWAEEIRDDLIGRSGRERLWDHIDAALYGEDEARTAGVNHETFYDKVVAWFEAA